MCAPHCCRACVRKGDESWRVVCAALILLIIAMMHFFVYLLTDTKPRIVGWIGFAFMSLMAITIFQYLPEIIAQASQ